MRFVVAFAFSRFVDMMHDDEQVIAFTRGERSNALCIGLPLKLIVKAGREYLAAGDKRNPCVFQRLLLEIHSDFDIRARRRGGRIRKRNDFKVMAQRLGERTCIFRRFICSYDEVALRIFDCASLAM